MLFRQTILYMPAQLLGPLFQFLSIISWTHFANEETVGIVTLLTATHELLQSALLVWWTQYTLRFTMRHQRASDPDLLSRTENIVLTLSTMAQIAVGLFFLHVVVAPGASMTLTIAFAAFIATRSLNFYLSERARARQEIALYTIQQTFGPAIGLVIGLMLLTRYGSAPEWPILGYVVAQVAALACAPLLTKMRTAFGRPDPTILREAVRYGLPLVGHNAFTWATLNASRFVVQAILGVAAAGLYGVGFGLGQRAGSISAMLVTAAAFPLVVKLLEEKDETAMLRQLADNAALLVAVLLPTCTGLAVLRQDVALTLIGTTFREAAITIVPISVTIGAVRNLRAHFFDQVFLLHQRTVWIFWITAIEAGIAVVFSLAGVYLGGLVGAAAGVLAGTLLGLAISVTVGLRTYQIVIPYGHFIRIAIAALGMMAVLAMFPVASDWRWLIGKIMLGAAVDSTILGLLYAPSLVRLLRAPEIACIRLALLHGCSEVWRLGRGRR
jgi:O-antigen/teichoic acid export membrane protein